MIDPLASQLATLDQADASVVTASGMGAIACTMLSLLRPGDELLASTWLRADTRMYLEHELTSCGIDVRFVDPSAMRDWRRASRRATRALFVESPSEGCMRLVDMRPLALLAHELGIALVVDSTAATPAVFRPLEHGADVVVHAGSRRLSGNPTSQVGVVSGAFAVIEEVQRKAERWGFHADGHARETLRVGLQTLDDRVARTSASAFHLATWAASVRAIAAVRYFGLESHPDHVLSQSQLRTGHSVLALDVDRDTVDVRQLMARLRHFAHAAAYTGTASIATTDDATDSVPSAPAASRSALETVWLGIGLEDPSILVGDLEHALSSVSY